MSDGMTEGARESREAEERLRRRYAGSLSAPAQEASAVDHPPHYNVGGHETIDVVESLGWGEGFNRGNALKYLMRAGHKDKSKELEDLRKARWYLNREIARLEGDG